MKGQQALLHLLLFLLAIPARPELAVSLRDLKYQRLNNPPSWTAHLSFSFSTTLSDLQGHQASRCWVAIRINSTLLDTLEVPWTPSPNHHIVSFSLPPHGRHEASLTWSLSSSADGPSRAVSEQDLVLMPECEFSSQVIPATWEAWMEQYSQFHSSVVRGLCSQRYLVFNATERRGLGNQMITLTSTLLAALATNRAFLVWWENPRRLRHFLMPRMFEWDMKELQLQGFLQDIETVAQISSDDDCEMLADIDADLVVHKTTQLCPLCVFLDNINWFQSSQVLSLVPEPRFYFFIGRTVSSLFSPSPALEQKLEALWGQRKACGSLIVLQIRVGTACTSGYEILKEEGERQIYRCARKIANASKDACLMIITDDKKIHPRAQQELAGLKLLLSEEEVIHVGLDHECSAESEEEIFSRLLGSFADWHVMGEADDAILSDTSSFGYSSYGRSMRLPITVWNHDEAEDRCERRTWGPQKPFPYVNTAERFFPPHAPLDSISPSVHPFTHIPVRSSGPGSRGRAGEEREIQVDIWMESQTTTCRCRFKLSPSDDASRGVAKLSVNDTLVFSAPLRNVLNSSEEVDKEFSVSLHFARRGCFSIEFAVHIAFDNRHVKKWVCFITEEQDDHLVPLLSVLNQRALERMSRTVSLQLDPHSYDRIVEFHRRALVQSRRLLRWDFMGEVSQTCLGLAAFLLVDNCSSYHRHRQDWLRSIGFCHLYTYTHAERDGSREDKRCSDGGRAGAAVDVQLEGASSQTLLLAILEASRMQGLEGLIVLSDTTSPAADPSSISSSLQAAINELPQSADVLLLAYCEEDCSSEHEGRSIIIRGRRPACARDFLLTPAGARKLLALSSPFPSSDLSHTMTMLIASDALEAYLLRDPAFLGSSSPGLDGEWLPPCLQFGKVWRRTSRELVLSYYPSLLSNHYLSSIYGVQLPPASDASKVFWLHPMNFSHAQTAVMRSWKEPEGQGEGETLRVLVARSSSCRSVLGGNMVANGRVECEGRVVHVVEDRPLKRRLCLVISEAGDVDVGHLRSAQDSLVLLPGPASRQLLRELINMFSFPLVRHSFFVFCSRGSVQDMSCHKLAMELREAGSSVAQTSFPSLFHIKWSDVPQFLQAA